MMKGRYSQFLFWLSLAGALALTGGPVGATIINHYGGVYGGWSTNWNAISGINDPIDPLAEGRLDFVGDGNNPGGYYAADANYVYFRVQVHDSAPASNVWNGTLMVMIDLMGQGASNVPEYSFAWDTRQDAPNHGLELQVSNLWGTSWSNVRMADRDGSNGQKIAPPDFSLSGGDGYVRTVDSQASTNFGLTTYVDIAASWSFLRANTTLNTGQLWRVQFGSINLANDHNVIDYDVAGGVNPSDANSIQTWSSAIMVPEPASMALLVLAGLAVWRFRRK